MLIITVAAGRIMMDKVTILQLVALLVQYQWIAQFMSIRLSFVRLHILGRFAAVILTDNALQRKPAHLG